MKLENFLGQAPRSTVFSAHEQFSHSNFSQNCHTLSITGSLQFYSFYLFFLTFPVFGKSSCILVFVYSLSILITAFTEALAPLVLIHAHYFGLNCAMLGVSLLRDEPRQIYLWDVFENICAMKKG